MKDVIDILRPGLTHYVNRIKKHRPFAFIRYGDGEWKAMADLPLTDRQIATFANPADMGACDLVRATVVNAHRDNTYVMATCDPKSIRQMGHRSALRSWIEHNVPKWVRWHDGHIWRKTVLEGGLYPLLGAIKKQPLPVVLIGPKRIANIRKAGLPIARHIVTTPTGAWYNRAKIEHQVLLFERPALFAFSVGPIAKVMIHDLWPLLGAHSYLVDFGAMWEGLCGFKVRAYHQKLTPELIQRNLTGGD